MKKTSPSGLLDFSYSRMGMYLECPKKFEFRYVYKLPEKPKYYFAFGHSVHSALEFLYNVQQPPFPSMEELLQKFRQLWNASTWEFKGYKSKLKADDDFQKGLDMLGRYYLKHQDSLKIPLAVEFRSKIPVDGLNVIMIADRLDYLGDGKIAVVDYKTGKAVEREPDQLYMYQKLLDISPDLQSLAKERTGFGGPFIVDKMNFCHVPSLDESYFERADDKTLGVFWNKVLVVADDIRAKKFPATPGETKCRFCDFADRCDRGAAVYRAPAPVAAESSFLDEPPAAAQDPLAAKIDRLGELAAQSDKIAADMETLRKEISALMRERGFTRHFGKKFQAKLDKTQRFEIADDKALLAALTETGLLQRTLVPTRKTVEKLLSSADISDEQRAKLAPHAVQREAYGITLGKIED